MLNLLLFSLTVVFPFLYLILNYISFPSSKRKPLPPGPKPWPIVGNILSVGKLPHISMAHFSKVYGPIVSLRFGTQLVVVASSPTAAIEILKTNDRLLSTRKVPHAFPTDILDLDGGALLWAASCNDGWKSLRTLCRTELFSTKAIESQTTLREKKVRDMVECIRSRQGEVSSIGELVFTVVFSTLTNLLFSKDLVGFEHVGSGAGELKNIMERIVDVSAGLNIAEFYPFLAGLDPQGKRGKLRKVIDELCATWQVELRARRERHVRDARKKDFWNVFIENGFDNDQINWITLELLMAGSDTTIATVEWAMVELLRNKQVLEKTCKELEREIGQNQMKESNVFQLPYLHACVKETLRLHPPVPLLVPRRAIETCEIMNYTVPKDSQIFVNVWAIGRDPSVWEDPLSFKPERFLSSNIDYKGQHFEFLPFGGGRRICPGLNMATRQTALILASLLHYFDWSLPNGEDPSKLDVNEKFGMVLQKENELLLVPNNKS